MSSTWASGSIARRAALIFLPCAAIAVFVTYLLYSSQMTAIRTGAVAAELRMVETARQRLNLTLLVVLSDVTYLANQDALLTWLDQDDVEALRHLQGEHVAFIGSRAVYRRVRVLDNTGQEVSRVDWDEGVPAVHPATGTIDAADRDLLQQTLALDRNQMLVSRITMDGADAASGQPGEAIICVSAPFFDRSARKRGIIVLKFRVQRLIDRIASLGNEATGMWLLDDTGNWIIGPQPAAAGRGDSGQFPAAYPELWQTIQGEAAGGMQETADGRFTYMRLRPVDYQPVAAAQPSGLPPVQGPTWFVLAHTPQEAIQSQSTDLRRNIVLATGILLLLLAVIAWGLARHQIQRQDSERRLRANEARFRDLLETAPDGIIITDRDGRIELVNTQIERQFGYPRHELIGRSIDMLVPASERQVHASHRDAYVAAARARQMRPGVEVRALRKDGSEFPVSITLSPTRTEQGLSVFCSIRDMTAQRETERQIQDLNRRLRHDNAELEAVNREMEAFSYSVSHDLRAPLRVISGFSQALQEDAGDRLDAANQTHLNRVREATRHMELLIDDMLTLASVSRTDMDRTSVDVSALARQILDDLVAAEPGRAIRIEIEPGLRAAADLRLLRIALENLLSNAVKFCAPQDSATIALGLEDTEAGRAFFVRDNGVGFDMSRADRLFRPFHRLHDGRRFPGTGIGLATVQRVIRRHGGRIWAKSAPGEGAVFYFTLQ